MNNKDSTIKKINLNGKEEKLIFEHPEGTFSMTPASHVSIEAILNNPSFLKGAGIDWGCGVGCLSIIAAKIENVKKVFGLDISRENIKYSIANSKKNNISEKTVFFESDSFVPKISDEKSSLYEFKGKIDFILSNPPFSVGDDGFGFRRKILEESREFLKKDGNVFLSVSLQYGMDRILGLVNEINGYQFEGLLASSDWILFDMSREDLRKCIRNYIEEEKRGGLKYTFKRDTEEKESISAEDGYSYYLETGKSPLSKWQTYRYVFKG